MLFTGERADVEALLPGLDVFAMASRYEGLPCAVVEAMGAGLPVVATAVNAVPDVVIAGETGLLVPPGRPELLGRAIGYLLDHPAEAARLGAAGRAQLGAELAPMRSAPCSTRPTWAAGRRRRVRAIRTGRVMNARHDGCPFCRTEITPGAQQAAVRVLASGWVTMGAETFAFEQEFGAWVGAPHTVAVSSCTAAIEMALAALGPAARGAGAHPDAHVLRCRPGDRPRRPAAGAGGHGRGHADRVRGRRGKGGQERAPRPWSIQHMAGYPVDSAELAAAAGIPAGNVVEDAAHGLGATVGGQPVGSFCRAGVLQLLRHQEPADRRGRRDHHDRRRPGRALAADAAARDERRLLAALPPVRHLAVHGRRRRDEGELDRPAGGHRPRAAASPADLAAATDGRSPRATTRSWRSVRGLGSRRARRRTCTPGICTSCGSTAGRSGWTADMVSERLAEAGIGTSVHFIPVHQLPYFRELLGWDACG